MVAALSSVRSVSGARVGAVRPSARRAARATLAVRNDSCLIVNTKGGGHAFLGLYLAKELLAGGHQVTIMNDGDEAKISGKAPFNQYSTLAGATVVYGNPEDPSTYPAGDFQVVYDNNGKKLDTCKPLIDTFKGKCEHFVFVGSAGAYVSNPFTPQAVEGDERKASAGHVEVENYLVEQDMPFTVFQPLYMYGAHTAKHYEHFFFDRIARGMPVPLPGNGETMTSLSHVADVASMMAKVPGCEAAKGQHYNACSDRAFTFNGVVKACAAAMGKEASVTYYDAEAAGLAKGEGIPFRTMHFFADCAKAKLELGWTPSHSFVEDAKALAEEYAASGRASATDIDFSADEKIAALPAAAVRTQAA